MDLRSNVETAIRGTAQTAHLHLKIQVENGVAIPVGDVHDLNEADEVADLAAKVNGITGVDRSRLRQEFGGPTDDELAAHVGRTLFELPKYASSSIKIAVENGVVTLTGAIKNAAWRSEIRKLCGALEGVVDVVDLLDTPETPDARIQKALDGRVPRLYDKQTAEHDARGINGVHRVDNRLELGSSTAIRVIDP